MAQTQIQARQIADAILTDAKIAPGAGILTSKLADGINFIKRDGSIPFTADQSHGGFKLTNVATPTGAADGATKGYIDTAISNLNSTFKMKPNARATAVINVVVANPATGTFDGVALIIGELLLLRVQTAPAENGLYTFNGNAVPLTRVAQMDVWAEVPGAFITVDEGTALSDTAWLCTANNGGTLGVTAITFTQVPTTPGLTSANFVDKEIPVGAINGVNVTYSLANTPITGSDHIYLNGVLQESGAGNDYTIAAAIITMLSAPLAGEKIRVSYRK